MSNKAKKTAASAATAEKAPRVAMLRSAPATYSDGAIQVDPDQGIIQNIALMSVGPAKGHGFDIDQTTIEQLVALAAQQPDGVKSRFKHPEITEKKEADGSVRQIVADDTGTRVGRIKNIRIVGDQARGDAYLGDYAAKIPGLGDVRGYLLTHAKTDPSGIGMSAMFSFDVEPTIDNTGQIICMPARLSSLEAIDFVGEPAANPNGLLSAGSKGVEPNHADPEIEKDSRSYFLQAIVKHGALHFGGIAARSQFNGRLADVRTACDWLVNKGYAEKLGDGRYKATPKGTTKSAINWQ